jgi:hypothetical protein
MIKSLRLICCRKYVAYIPCSIDQSSYVVRRNRFSTSVSSKTPPLVDESVKTTLSCLESDESVCLLRHPVNGRTVVVVGTNHLSEESVALVKHTIQTLSPDLVMLELDIDRVDFRKEGGANWKEVFILSSEETHEIEETLRTQDLSDKRKEENSFRCRSNRYFSFFKTLVTSPLRTMFAVFVSTFINVSDNLEKRMGFNEGDEFGIAIETAKACQAKIILGDKRSEMNDVFEAVRKTNFLK